MTAVLDTTEAPDQCVVRVSGIGQDVPWTGTGGVTDIQSYSWVIGNAIFDRLSAMSLFRGWTIRRINRALPIESGIHIPFLGLYQSDEVLSPDGDFNAGDIRFKHLLNLGFQIVVRDNDPVQCLQTLDRCSWFLMNQLLRDNTLNNKWRTSLPDNTTIEGWPRGRIRERWGLTGQKNETPVGERLVELSVQFRTEWWPTEFPDLHRIAVRSLPTLVDDPDAVHNVVVVYDFNPDAVPNPLPPDAQTPLPFPPFTAP
jgi:hypothetical protein